MTEIEWHCSLNTPNADIHPLTIDPLFFEPESLLQFVAKNSKDLNLLKCPSVRDYLQNTFIIKSPLDFTIKITDDKIKVVNNKQNYKEPYELYDLNMIAEYRSPEKGILYNTNCIDVGFQYYFINKNNNVIMENLDVPLWFNKVTNVPGQFNISKWVRPTNFTFFTDRSEISFKRGEPLYAVRFIIKNQDKVKLKKITDLDRINKISLYQHQSTSIKRFLPNLSLNSVYKMFESKMEDLFK